MTQQLEFVCLANSWREGGRCVAGVRTDDPATWVRPVPRGNGPLSEDSCRGFGPFDVVRVEVTGQTPDRYQPENWELMTDRVVTVGRLPRLETPRLLRRLRFEGSDLFGDASTRIAAVRFDASPARASLLAVAPTNVEWIIEATVTGRKRVRAAFTLAAARTRFRSQTRGGMGGSLPCLLVSDARAVSAALASTPRSSS